MCCCATIVWNPFESYFHCGKRKDNLACPCQRITAPNSTELSPNETASHRSRLSVLQVHAQYTVGTVANVSAMSYSCGVAGPLTAVLGGAGKWSPGRVPPAVSNHVGLTLPAAPRVIFYCHALAHFTTCSAPPQAMVFLEFGCWGRVNEK